MGTKTIHIPKVISPCVSRAGGEQVGKLIQRYAEDNKIIISLDEDEFYSCSFLDGLVSHLVTYDLCKDILFKVGQASSKEKITQVAANRGVNIQFV